MKLQDIATALRRLRQHLDAGAHPARWSATLDRYDRHLLDAATMLEVPVPLMARGRRLLSDEDRADLEQALAEAGLDVRAALPGGAR